MKILALLLLVSTTASAAPKPEPEYQDATLKSFKMIPAGQSCHTSGGSTTTTDLSGNSTSAGGADTNCTDTTVARYTLIVGEQILVVQPSLSKKGKLGAFASLGWSAALAKESCLYGQLPGAHVLIRSEGGTYHVKVGKRESIYKLVGAQ